MKKISIEHRTKNKNLSHGLMAFIIFVVLLCVIVIFVYITNHNNGSLQSNASTSSGSLDGAIESSIAAAESDVMLRLEALKEEFPDGKYWNHYGITLEEGQESWSYVTDTPCNHDVDGTYNCNIYDGATLTLFPDYEHLTQCLGFSSLISDRLFGEDAAITVFHDYEQLRIGDQIRLTADMHSMIVLSKNDDYITVVEVDEDTQSCRISWGRIVYCDELAGYGEDIQYFTRYPVG